MHALLPFAISPLAGIAALASRKPKPPKPVAFAPPVPPVPIAGATVGTGPMARPTAGGASQVAAGMGQPGSDYSY